MGGMGEYARRGRRRLRTHGHEYMPHATRLRRYEEGGKEVGFPGKTRFDITRSTSPGISVPALSAHLDGGKGHTSGRGRWIASTIRFATVWADCRTSPLMR